MTDIGDVNMDSLGTPKTFSVAGTERRYFPLGDRAARLPYSLKVLLENLLRAADGKRVTNADIEALLDWNAKAEPSREILFTPARVLMQDFTGVPCVVDLASMRDAMAELGGDPNKVNPLQPVELVIDHSVQVDAFGSDRALQINLDLEFERNQERYEFLKWGQSALNNFKVVPPNTGICHQVNLEYLARVVFEDENGLCFPDTLVGTDSHTTMVNGLGVLGWGVGGIEAEAAMLGQPMPMLIPQVVGFKITGKLSEGATATDLVLTVTEMLRKHVVVGKFVEFFGPGISNMPLADRATIANMAPEYGATCGIFPVDQETLRYLRTSGRPEEQIDLVEAYMKAQGMFHNGDTPDAEYSSVLELDLSTVEPSVAGPKRPQDRVPLSKTRDSYLSNFPPQPPTSQLSKSSAAVLERPQTESLTNGSVVIAAITSCTNTSNPSVMVAAGLVAKKARGLGLRPKPWVKTSLAPGSRVVTEYLKKSGLLDDLESIGFNVVGYGCTTCIGNSGPLPAEVQEAIDAQDLTVVSVLSGNRNFEGRVQQAVKANYLMSPPLVVAYALAGSIDIDLINEPLGKSSEGRDVFLRDVWPTQAEIADTVAANVDRDMFQRSYAGVYDGDDKWKAIPVSNSQRYGWGDHSTYIKKAPYFEGMTAEAKEHVEDLSGLKVLALLGDSVTTDHISPAGAIKPNSPAGMYLESHNVGPKDFNSYGSRRGNHEVMIRGTFANIRLRNQIAPGTEGGFTTCPPGDETMFIFDAAEKYAAKGDKLIVIAGKEYGTGSSRDWAAKGTMLLGVKAVLAESFERIHRSNLIGMGVLPLQFAAGESASTLGLTGLEEFAVVGFSQAFEEGFAAGKVLDCRATLDNGETKVFKVTIRLDTPTEADYYRHGGVLPYVLRNLLKS